MLILRHLYLLVMLAFAGNQLVLASEPVAVPAAIADLLQQHCADCHSGDSPEAEITLDRLDELKLDDQLTVLNAALEQLHFGLMPPADAASPSSEARDQLQQWLTEQLDQRNANQLRDKLRKPEYGNHVDHDALFSGEHANRPGFTYDRRWLISEYIFDAKFNRILNHNVNVNIDGKRQAVIGSNKRRVNLTNPFLLPTHSGVRYYANETLNGGHLLTMLTNAKEAGTYMLYLAGRDQRYLPAVTKILSLETQHEKTLAARERFLNQHVETVLENQFADEHAKLLPVFVRVDVPAPIPNDGSVKKAPFHAANPGNKELELIFRSMQRHQADGLSDQLLIENCEREWFYHGHNPRTIQARITFLNNYMEEFRGQIKQHRFAEKYKPVQYRPLSELEMQVVQATVQKHRARGDRYDSVIKKCLEQWRQEFEQARIDAGPPEHEVVSELVQQLFEKILERPPTEGEQEKHVALATDYLRGLGNQEGIKKLIQTLILNTDFVYRNEFGQGEADQYGRRMLSPRDASYALAYALTDSSPDAELQKAVKEGRLSSREDFEREVRRMLARRDQFYIVDESVHRPNDLSSFTQMPIRELRFVREYFGYQRLLPIFKDNKRFGASYDAAKLRLVSETDRLVDHILEQDQNVFHELLTTDKFYVFHSGDNEVMQASADRIRRIYEHFKDTGWSEFEVDDLGKHKDFIAAEKMRGIDVNRLFKDRRYNPLNSFKTQLTSFTLRLDKGQAAAAPYNSFPAHGMANAASRYGGRFQSPEVARFYNIDMSNWDYQPIQPAAIESRKGLLTSPAWLIAHAKNTETDPIQRGKWIREKLLAGSIPDVPITVDAVIPEDPHKTLRERMEAKTGDQYCWKCHQKMNPLGLPFESFDDFGRYRTEESLEYPENLVEKVKDKGAPHEDLRDIYKTRPVVSTGYLSGTGDKTLDGEVDNAFELIDRIAQSDRARQSMIRYAFRYFMGRNETLSDSKTLLDAQRAYLESGGSFDELIVSLLTSDSFIYRKPTSDML